MLKDGDEEAHDDVRSYRQPGWRAGTRKDCKEHFQGGSEEAAGKLIGETLWGNRLTNIGHYQKGKSPTVWRHYLSPRPDRLPEAIGL